MGKKTQEEGKGGATQVDDFVVAKVGGKFVRFPTAVAVPKGSEPIDLEAVSAMTRDAIGEMYGAIAGVPKKNFKSKQVAVESVVYQVAKMAIFDPSAATVAPGVAGPGAEGKRGGRRKANGTLELLQPANVDEVLRALAPQARELVLIMTDLAKEKGTTAFGISDLEAELKVPGVAARLRTKQDSLRILQYYKGKLIAVGLIKVS